MRVLHVFKWYYCDSRGGTEKAIQQLAASCAKEGIKSTILCIARDDYGQQSRPRAFSAAYSKGEYGEAICRCAPTLHFDSITLSARMAGEFARQSRKHDLIHYHFPFPQQDIMHLLLNPRCPALVTYHSDIVRQRFLSRLYAPLMNSFLARMDAVVASSENYLASSPVLQRFREKTVVIPYGLEEKSYPDPSFKTQQFWRDKVGEDFFLFVGALRYYKGLDILLKAATMTTRKFVIVGSGLLEKALREKARELRLDNVHFVGQVSEEDKVALFRLCLAVLFPSNQRSEAFGFTLLEGAMFGKPLISAEIGTGTSYINREGQTGLVIPANDSPALAEAVERLAADRELRERFGRNARARYQELFTADRYAKNHKNLYEKLTASRPR
ncbi:MAG: glycosyltransferase [Desulfurivibrionaceae bacterium]